MKKLFFLIVIFCFKTLAQIPTLQSAPTSPSPSTNQGTGPTLGGAMSGGDPSIYSPSRGNEFPQERMETPGVIESFEDQQDESITYPENTDEIRGDLPPGEIIPGVVP